MGKSNLDENIDLSSTQNKNGDKNKSKKDKKDKKKKSKKIESVEESFEQEIEEEKTKKNQKIREPAPNMYTDTFEQKKIKERERKAIEKEERRKARELLLARIGERPNKREREVDAKDAETQEPQKKLKKDQPSPDKNKIEANDNESKETEQQRLARLLWESNKTVQKDSKQFEKRPLDKRKPAKVKSMEQRINRNQFHSLM